MSQQLFVGVDVGGTKTAVSASVGCPEILERIVFPTESELGPEPTLRRIIQAIHRIHTTHHLDIRNIAAIGVSCGSPLDTQRGIIQAPPNLPTWKDVHIKSILEQEFQTKCFLENDANAGALAEWRFGAGRNTRNMVFLTMGTGIGGGLILNGRLYRGATQLAGEIGHVRLTRTGPLGHNKNGTVEGWASGSGMARVAEAAIPDLIARGGSTSLLSLANGHSLSARDIWHAAQSGDRFAKDLVTSTGERLGEGLAILIDVLNPECIVVGGLALRMGDALLGPARAVVEKEALSESAHACRIVPAALGESIGDIAALCVALEGLGRPASGEQCTPDAAFESDLDDAVHVFSGLRALKHAVIDAANTCIRSIKSGHKLLACGNGGSASEAQHLVAELLGKFRKERDPLPALAFTADSAVLTCIGNDFNLEDVFSRQLQALGQPGDVLIAFTTSGNSPNIVKALERARAQKITSIAFLGGSGGAAAPLAYLPILVPGVNTARIQEGHQFLMHSLVEMIEMELFP